MKTKELNKAHEKYLSGDYNEYMGQWVAIGEEGVLAHSKTTKGLMQIIKKKKLQDTIITKIRDPKEIRIGG